jgi:hypothetical protein
MWGECFWWYIAASRCRVDKVKPACAGYNAASVVKQVPAMSQFVASLNPEEMAKLKGETA